MMKIHTTQNLNSRINVSPTNSTIPNEYRLRAKSKRQYLLNNPDSNLSSITFKGKKDIVKKVVDKAKNAAGKEKKIDKILTSGFFDKLLDLMSHEVFVQAAISALICIILRPITIMLIPTKKNKKDNMYASSHSIASGVAGILSSLLIAVPFSKGIRYSQNNHFKNLSVDILKEKFPNLDLNSIWQDSSKKLRKPIESWLDKSGNPFSKDFKNVMKVAKPKHISEVSEQTLKKAFGIDIDLQAMKDKSVNEWTDRKGNKIKFNLKDMFIAVKEEGMGGSLDSMGSEYKNTNFFSLMHMDEKFLQEIFPNLDINSTKASNINRLHTDCWKNKDGSKFVLDMDMIHLSSYRETADAIPLFSGVTRQEGSNKYKYMSYQLLKDPATGKNIPVNGVPDRLGTGIKQEYLDADKMNDISDKILGWLPDIITRPFVASGTIALIPWVLSSVFHVEKSKKTADTKPEPAKTIDDSSVRKAVA